MMNKFREILKYAKPYPLQASLNAAFNILSVFFNLFSMAIIIPMLGMIMGKGEGITEKPELTYELDTILDSFYYYLGQLDGKMEALAYLCGFVLVMFFLKNLTTYMALFFISPVRVGVVTDIRKKVYRKILSLPLAYYTEARKGDIISRMSNDLHEIEWSILTALEAMFRDPLHIIVILTVLFMMSFKLTIIVLVLIPIAGILIALLGKSVKKASLKEKSKLGEIIARIEETLGGLRVLKAFNAEDYSRRNFEEANNIWKKITVSVYRKQSLSNPMGELIGAVMVVIVMWIGGREVLVEGTMRAEMFIGYIVFFSQIIRPAKALTSTYINVKRGMASVKRINEILLEEQHIPEAPNAISKNSFDESISFKEVSFAYDEVEVLRKVSLEISKGETIALVGPSGGGKTTLADLLPRFHDYQKGMIALDGIELTNYKLSDLRSLIGVVTQESILFNDTVANNIALGIDNPKIEEVINAARIANAHEFIEKLEKGYETNIGEGGSKLSGGQRQRLSIARAVLKNPPILILDEATSSLDTESEKLVQDALFNLMKDRTSLVIAHRLSTIKSANQIVVIDKGEIKEQGTHDELLAKSGVYSRLHALQTFE